MASAAHAQAPDTTTNNASYWFDKGMALYQQQKYTDAAPAFERAYQLKFGFRAAYNAGCMYALARKPDDAFPWLTKAVKDGAISPNTLMQDPDLANIRSDSRFQALTALAQTTFSGGQ